jgi:hypothetical protein
MIQGRSRNMPFARAFGGVAVATLLLAGCDTTPKQGPLATMPTGTNESLLRQQQLQNARQTTGMQNPAVTTVNPGAGGIERSTTGGMGNAAAGAPAAVNPGTTGIVRQGGVGAPVR